jgi:L-malate glycosyltransferase
MSYRVLQLIDSFNLGGSERQAVQLARLLSESGRFSVYVACLNSEGPLHTQARLVSAAKIPQFRLKSFYDANMAVQTRRFASFLKEHRIDVVHTHDFYTNVFGMAGATVARVPVRVASKRETVGVRSPMQERVERGAYRLAHSIIANSEAVRNALSNAGVNREKVRVIHNGLDMAHIKAGDSNNPEAVRAKLGLPSSRPLVTMVANMNLAVKDQPTFLRAARRVKQTIADAAFVLAGDGILTEQYKALVVELGLEADAFFTGACTNVPQLLAISTVCVLSSKAEGFSNSILEYMAAGKPAVVTDVGGAREAISDGESGFIVPIGDDGALAEKLCWILSNEESARTMGERARSVVEQQFSCAAQLRRTEELYESLLAKHSYRVPERATAAQRETTQT